MPKKKLKKCTFAVGETAERPTFIFLFFPENKFSLYSMFSAFWWCRWCYRKLLKYFDLWNGWTFLCISFWHFFLLWFLVSLLVFVSLHCMQFPYDLHVLFNILLMEFTGRAGEREREFGSYQTNCTEQSGTHPTNVDGWTFPLLQPNPPLTYAFTDNRVHFRRFYRQMHSSLHSLNAVHWLPFVIIWMPEV